MSKQDEARRREIDSSVTSLCHNAAHRVILFLRLANSFQITCNKPHLYFSVYQSSKSVYIYKTHYFFLSIFKLFPSCKVINVSIISSNFDPTLLLYYIMLYSVY